MKFKKMIPLMVLTFAVSRCGNNTDKETAVTETTTEVITEEATSEETTAEEITEEIVNEESTTAETTTQMTTNAVVTQATTESTAAKPAASTNTKPSDSTPTVQPPKEGNIGVTLKNTKILLNTSMDNVSKILGSTTDYSEAPSCNYDGLDKVFTYGDVNIYTYPHPSGDIINEIEINDAAITTDKGIAPIGKTIEDIKAVYGEPTAVEGVTYKYADGDCYTYFYADNGTVTYWGVAVEQ